MKFAFIYKTNASVVAISRVFEAASWFEALQLAQRFFRCERSQLTWSEIDARSAGVAGVIDNRKAPGA